MSDEQAGRRHLVWLLEDSTVEAQRTAATLSAIAEVRIFTDGLALVEAFEASGGAPDLLLLDWNVPGMNGLEVCQFVRRRLDEVMLPVVMLTGSSEVDDIVGALSCGANDFVVKPFRPAELVARLLRALKVRNLGETVRAARSSSENKLALAAAELQHKDRYISVLGHDLRNPLAAILGSAALLKAKGDDAIAKLGVRIERNAHRMGLLVRDILDFARIGYGGGLTISRSPGSLDVACREVVDEMLAVHPTRKIELEVVGDTHGRWDPDRFMQALSNLVANAVQHSDSGVTVRADGSSSEHVEVSVHNWGEGIPEAEVPALFEPFRVRQSPTAGVGLGLYIVREVVTAHQGTIRVVSGADSGTTFVLTLPRGL